MLIVGGGIDLDISSDGDDVIVLRLDRDNARNGGGWVKFQNSRYTYIKRR